MSWFDRFFKKPKSKAVVLFANSIQLQWDDYFWAGRTVLPAWAGFQKRLGPYSSVSGVGPSNGEVQLSISSPDSAIQSSPSDAQLKGFHFLRDNDLLIKESVLKAVFDVYPQCRENYQDFLGEELETMMPVLQTPSDLKALMGLATIHILNVEKDCLAYVGFEFGCNWDKEHGLGVMSHKGRIIDVGSAEDAFSASAASADQLIGSNLN